MLTAPFLPFFDPTFNTLGLYEQAGRASKFTGSHGKNGYSAFSLKFHIGHIEIPLSTALIINNINISSLQTFVQSFLKFPEFWEPLLLYLLLEIDTFKRMSKNLTFLQMYKDKTQRLRVVQKAICWYK